jgi:hypothetical protein
MFKSMLSREWMKDELNRKLKVDVCSVHRDDMKTSVSENIYRAKQN